MVASTQIEPRRDRARERRARRRARLVRRLLLPLFALVVIAAIVVGVALGTRGEPTAASSPSATGSPEMGGSPEAGGSTPPSSAAADTAGSAADAGAGATASTTGASNGDPADTPVTPARARNLAANEMGLVPVLMYHKIGYDIVPPPRLWQDIQQLKEAGFWPATVRELAEGLAEIPAGKSAVVFTFDDSSPTHYRILEDGSIDSDSAMGIIRNAAKTGDWAVKATFFPLIEVNAANTLFGQPEYADEKLRNMVEWGCEIGSHTLTHPDLSVASPATIAKELAQSQAKLEARIGDGYEVFTLSPPYGEYPDDASVLVSGEYEGVTYRYSAVVLAGGESGPSPFSSRFDPIRIPRITAYPKNTVPNLIQFFQSHPGLRYVSDGDPDTISLPLDLAESLGTPRTDLTQSIVRY